MPRKSEFRFYGAVKFPAIVRDLPSGYLIRVYKRVPDDVKGYVDPSLRGTLYVLCDRKGLHLLNQNEFANCIDDVAALLNSKSSPEGWSLAGYMNPKEYGISHPHFL